jgi:long-chain acyl-CoA synthetase
MMYASPTHYEWMADAAGDFDLGRLRLALSTTAPLTGEVGAKFRHRFGTPLSQALGIIEIGLPFVNVEFAANRCESVGRILPAYRMKLLDVGGGSRCREILLAGPGMFEAYYEPWRLREEVMPSGWFETGDVGEVDENGCLLLRGRTKDVINVMGMKLFPQEVESLLDSHPAVAEAAVLREFDARLGEVPVARIVLKDTARATTSDELLDFCRRHLATYKIPTRFDFVDALGKTATGKVLHRAV